MRKIILDLAVTLDGFIEGPNGEIDWIRGESGAAGLLEFVKEVDTVLYGRISYDLWGNYIPDDDAPDWIRESYAMIHQMEKYVYSHSKKKGEGNATFIASDITAHVQELKQQPGKDIWLYGGAKLVTTFMNLGLVDELRLAVYPVILGDGKRLFNDLTGRTDLELIEAKGHESGVTELRYGKA